MALENLCMGCMNDKGVNTVCPVCGYTEGTAPASPLFLPPRTILNGRYITGKVLGAGGFGITYLAWDGLEARKTAIKEYFPEGAVTRNPGFPGASVYSGSKGEFFRGGLEKFLAEAEALKQFKDHAGIVSVCDFFQGNNTAYIVMEYLEGETLANYLAKRGGILPFNEALSVLADIFPALAEVHKSHMLHRDIKPDNIFVLEDGKRAMLIDFGAARQFVGQCSKSLSSLASDGYAPFEQSQEDGEQGAWTDVYALGATLYRMLSGEKPPQATSRISRDKLVPLAAKGLYLPLRADAAIRKALAVQAKDRYQSIAEFGRALAEACTERTERYPYVSISDTPSSVREKGRTRSISSGRPFFKLFPPKAVLLGLVLFIFSAFLVRGDLTNRKAAGDYINRGKAYANSGSFDAAIAEYDKAIQLNPKRADVYYERGNAYWDKGACDEALSDYNEAIELDPKSAAAYNGRGNAYLQKGIYDGALADYSKAIELDPQYPTAYYNRGNIYLRKGLCDEAIADYNKALELDPKYAAAYSDRGNAYCQKGLYDTALADYSKTLELDPKHVSAYSNRAAIYLKKGLYDKAVADDTKVIELDRKNVKAYTNRGTAYRQKGLYDAAIADFNKVIELDPNNAAAYYGRGNAYKAKGLYDKARADFSKASELKAKAGGSN